MIPHFFKARSRFGIVNKPIHQEDHNLGVEKGPDYILDSSFLGRFEYYKISSFDFPNPDGVLEGVYFDLFSKTISDFKDLINRELKDGEKQIVIGGDHIVSLSSVLAVIDRFGDPSKIGYVHFDSHGDINQYYDSPTKNFHGMYLRPLFDKFDIEIIDNLVPDKIPPENLLIVGNLDLDPTEKKFIKGQNIKTISRQSLITNNKQTLEEFESFINAFEHLHVSFDGDVLDKSIFPATGIPADNGFELSEIMSLIKIISKHKNISFDLAEYNPQKEINEKSKIIAQEILLAII